MEKLQSQALGFSATMKQKLLQSQQHGKSVEMEYNSKLQHMEEDHQTELTELKRKHDSMLQAEKDKSTKHLLQLEQKITALEADNVQLRESFQQKQMKKQEEIERLNGEIEDITEQLKVQKNRFQVMTQSRDENVAIVDELKETIREQNTQIDQLKKEKSDAECLNVELQEKLDDAKKQLSKRGVMNKVTHFFIGGSAQSSAHAEPPHVQAQPQSDYDTSIDHDEHRTS